MGEFPKGEESEQVVMQNEGDVLFKTAMSTLLCLSLLTHTLQFYLGDARQCRHTILLVPSGGVVLDQSGQPLLSWPVS